MKISNGANYTFNSNGNLFTVFAKDVDRARCAAKRLAGDKWSPKARLVKIGCGI